ncbi:hypothetical protein RFI_16978 [Reticulomyxa filosa]|uniref:Uncharacterized protein n=1 Tax=Reticulomyxa filosa TaxID=46433 RepID=X6N2W0_RETFI|nr:hypothetical protein RFI_16978 [Reticulomyxa filosa]|eukprot:ETO20238.1 hypothetical protein RFI_16978 [Reticulomyxa filosa]
MKTLLKTTGVQDPKHKEKIVSKYVVFFFSEFRVSQQAVIKKTHKNKNNNDSKSEAASIPCNESAEYTKRVFRLVRKPSKRQVPSENTSESKEVDRNAETQKQTLTQLTTGNKTTRKGPPSNVHRGTATDNRNSEGMFQRMKQSYEYLNTKNEQLKKEPNNNNAQWWSMSTDDNDTYTKPTRGYDDPLNPIVDNAKRSHLSLERNIEARDSSLLSSPQQPTRKFEPCLPVAARQNRRTKPRGGFRWKSTRKEKCDDNDTNNNNNNYRNNEIRRGHEPRQTEDDNVSHSQPRNALSRIRPRYEAIIDLTYFKDTNTYFRTDSNGMEEDEETRYDLYEVIEEDSNDLICVKPKTQDRDDHIPTIVMDESISPLQKKYERAKIRKKVEHLSSLGEFDVTSGDEDDADDPNNHESEEECGEDEEADEDNYDLRRKRKHAKQNLGNAGYKVEEEEEDLDWEDNTRERFYQGHFDNSHHSSNANWLWFHDSRNQNTMEKTHADELIDMYDQLPFE